MFKFLPKSVATRLGPSQRRECWEGAKSMHDAAEPVCEKNEWVETGEPKDAA